MAINDVLLGSSWNPYNPETPPEPIDEEALALALLKTQGKYDSMQDQAAAIIKLLNPQRP